MNRERNISAWIALAMDVTTRLWLAGTVSQHRDRTLIDLLFQRVRACCHMVQGLPVCTDGFAAYPKSIIRAFREKVKKQAGPGRCSLEVWPDVCIATVIKHTKKKRVVEITRKEAKKAKKTDSNHNSPIAPNLLERDFTADAPNKKWMTE